MIGETLLHYRIVGRLGEGGMGVVYKAEDMRLGLPVALKLLPEHLANDRDALTRFHREARAAAMLTHPNICAIYDVDEYEGRHFIAMELLEGQTLKEHMLSRRLAVDEAVTVALEAADGLGAAHAEGIIHRDIKPANIFVTRRGEAKILDFGLAKLARQRRAETDVATVLRATFAAVELGISHGAPVGTVAYMSPEQALGKDVDERTDVFSLGVVLYEMATGQHPFPGDTLVAVFDHLLHRAPIPPTRLNPDVPEALDAIISRALEKDRHMRYQSAREMAVDLARLKRERDEANVPRLT